MGDQGFLNAKIRTNSSFDINKIYHSYDGRCVLHIISEDLKQLKSYYSFTVITLFCVETILGNLKREKIKQIFLN